MSLTALAWLACFGVLALATFKRPAWGIALYMLTYYACPVLWWWGGPISAVFGHRVSLLATVIFAAALFGTQTAIWEGLSRSQRTILLALLLYALNATLVHVLFAANPERSAKGLTLLWKYVGLLLLICAAVRTRYDFKILVWSIILGSLYIGYEVVINKRGYGGRLEHIGAPGARESNYLAGLMCLALPLAGYWLFFGSRWVRVASLVVLVLVFEVVLRCNSRGAFLGLMAGGGWILIVSRGKTRRYAICGVLLALLAASFMVKDEAIKERFLSTFVPAEERDTSAQLRLDAWGAAIEMIRDYPYGRGAEAAFKSEVGARYVAPFIDHGLAVHQGYLDIAASWGIQGVVLYLLIILYAWVVTDKTCRAAKQRGDPSSVFLGACLQASLITQLVACAFISSLDGEWFFWYFALATGYARLYSTGEIVSSACQPAISRGRHTLGPWPAGGGACPVRWRLSRPGAGDA